MMSRRLLAIGAFALLLLGSAGGDTVGDVLDALQKRYDSVKDLRADFVQTSHVVSVGRKEVSRGVITVMRPGHMRWEYSAPEQRVIVMDGETLQIYTPADGQLQIASLGSGAVSPTALSFLLGDGILRQVFEVAGTLESDRNELGLKLRPRQDSGFEFLELWLDPRTYQLRESVVLDLFGNRTGVRFRKISENTGVVEEVFSIEVPDDTEVIDLR
jgi:outer membrane lipoprotein carrier protein